MKTPALLLLACATFALLAAGNADARGCKPFHVKVIDTPAPQGCPTFFCTSGLIEGNHGLRGTIDATFDSYAASPSTTPEPGRTNSFSSVSVITTARGTLTARETLIASTQALDPKRRMFAGFAEFTGGTGAYAGATGYFQFGGRQHGGVNVTDTMVGQICLP
ncbi:hypothetical protein [Montanilutibacter psychrotolerans]|nr:hypothetical protein [Lysobacter psychrotolerans]